MKNVLDSVHGNISIPKELFEKVIDTTEFQRLRRIEQNSCRSVYPSARHDRFIHSLGVYYIGSRIADEIKRKFLSRSKPEDFNNILETYKLACLLHDVGHTPFSHTFEEYFNWEDALEQLKIEIDNNIGAFSRDVNFITTNKTLPQAAPHEILSALVAITSYRKEFPNNSSNQKNKAKIISINWELLCRMITGYRYLDGDKPNKSFENAMIELIHGDIIDADGLDYVCRDVWAGGYRNFNINLNRLIGSINIENINANNNSKKNSSNEKRVPEYQVIYSSKALNEIETVLNVKNFQYLYVIKHHKVLLEQHYLKEGMKTTACYHLDRIKSFDPNKDNWEEYETNRKKSLNDLCHYKIFTEPMLLNKTQYKIWRPMDDDFVALMKLVDDKSRDCYIDGWFSRNFKHKPLWKSKLEFFNIFSDTLTALNDDFKFEIADLLVSEDFLSYISKKINDKQVLKKDSIIVIKIDPKIRNLDPTKINIQLNGKTIPYSSLIHDSFSVIGSKKPFCYVYVDLDTINETQKNKKTPITLDTVIEYIKGYVGNELLKRCKLKAKIKSKKGSKQKGDSKTPQLQNPTSEQQNSAEKDQQNPPQTNIIQQSSTLSGESQP